jgi:hypothetical protein
LGEVEQQLLVDDLLSHMVMSSWLGELLPLNERDLGEPVAALEEDFDVYACRSGVV